MLSFCPHGLRRLAPPALLCALALLAARPAHAAASPRQTLRFDAGWRFHLGDIEGFQATAGGTQVDRWRWKAEPQGEASAAAMAAPDLNTDGAEWRETQTGRDVFGGREGFAWFRTALPTVPAVKASRRVLHFDGVDDNAVVYLNGRRLVRHDGWDEAFDVPLDAAWRADGPNVLAVLVENTDGMGGIIGAVSLQSGEEATAGGAAAAKFDDSGWRAVHLPHDFVVEGAFDPNADNSHGSLPGGVGWYRKSFTLPASDRGKRLSLRFDGVYRNSTAWLNGHRLGTHLSGYTSFEYDVTRFARPGAANVLAVRADARTNEGWWYEGGGIYRHVWLVRTDPVHVGLWGTFVKSTVLPASPSAPSSAELSIQTTVANDSGAPTECRLTSEVVDAAGKRVAVMESPARAGAGQTAEITQKARIAAPRLWSLESPYLYRLVTTIRQGGKVRDLYTTPFGIRTIAFDPDKGFLLNGKPVKIQGTCNHQDFAGIGVALPDRVHVYKIQKLKEMGANGYRCSHHPPAPEILDACDRLGMLVMDENRKLGDSPAILEQVESMVRRDRNHPSVVIWSLCNEERAQGTERGAAMGQAMAEVIRKWDGTRPITAAMNGGHGAGLTQVVDVLGFNYNTGAYDPLHQRFPKLPLIATETTSAFATRGIYADDKERGYCSSYDGNPAGWGSTTINGWRALAERPFMAGGFVWTGFDYRGEPTPYRWPDVSSQFGILDTCGFPKDPYYYYQAWWSGKPVLHLFPHWNAPAPAGQEVPVWCYSNCERVELFLNGKSLGAQEMKPNGHLVWRVKYEPGVLMARGTWHGKEITDTVETTGAPAKVALAPEQTEILADGEDVAMVAVSLQDAQGRVVPTAGNLVQFRVQGDGRVLGVGNGDPTSHEPDKASQRHAFNGRCLVILQAGTRGGTLKLAAESPGLAPASVTLRAKRVAGGEE